MFIKLEYKDKHNLWADESDFPTRNHKLLLFSTFQIDFRLYFKLPPIELHWIEPSPRPILHYLRRKIEISLNSATAKNLHRLENV